MQLSARKLNKNIEKQIFAILYQVINDLKSEGEVTTVINDLLSETEKSAVAKRLAIATFLDKGRSYENIRETLKKIRPSAARFEKGGFGTVTR